MRKDFEKPFSHFELAEPPAGLFDRIIMAIKREQELRHTRRLVFGFFSLLIVSLAAIPFSWTMLSDQIESSGISYFVSTAVNDFGTSLALWQDFGLAILESLPIMAMIVFALSLGLAVFTLRLFLYRRRLLLNYLISYGGMQRTT